MPYRRMRPGDRFRCVGPCGGGYGRAAERAPEAVRSDVLDGLLSADEAARHYAVILDPALNIDSEATARARAAL
jgi:N-methylhydantoinase B